MIEDDSKTGKNSNKLEPEGDSLTTLFSSDNTELTDFTEKVTRAILGEEQVPENEQPDIGAAVDQKKDRVISKPTLVSSVKSNVVNLFEPK
jgi:hypothetical protein